MAGLCQLCGLASAFTTGAVPSSLASVETRRSRSKPDRGLVRTRGELLNQDDRAVLSLIAMNLFGLRDGAEGGPGRSG